MHQEGTKRSWVTIIVTVGENRHLKYVDGTMLPLKLMGYLLLTSLRSNIKLSVFILIKMLAKWPGLYSEWI